MRLSDERYYDKAMPVNATHGRLPHWEQGRRVIFVTFRLADSLPTTLIAALRHEGDDISALLRDNPGDKELLRRQREWHNRWERLLDAGHGSCLMRTPEIRAMVSSALLHFNGERCLVHSFVIMPNHVHALIEPVIGFELHNILRSVKSYSARKINEAVGTEGKVWQREGFDRIVRCQEHYDNCMRYIHNNPTRLAPGTFTLWDAKPQSAAPISQ